MVVICDKPYPKEHEETYQEHFQKFPYPLSDFQKYSIQAIVDGNHTLVSAATGNGKTVSADFAIQHFVVLAKQVPKPPTGIIVIQTESFGFKLDIE